ncbi:hypothetical protein [Spiroplasma endosymbiont of Aspidapion aeneum]|uniref:hypothetical protein n=1 Tax=Spiroplasma endosymbiont of Aspidapion aeneum TaxID=3066276 RepID=UPI00313EA4A9
MFEISDTSFTKVINNKVDLMDSSFSFCGCCFYGFCSAYCPSTINTILQGGNINNNSNTFDKIYSKVNNKISITNINNNKIVFIPSYVQKYNNFNKKILSSFVHPLA